MELYHNIIALRVEDFIWFKATNLILNSLQVKNSGWSMMENKPPSACQ